MLDTGSGRGLIALNAATWANASVVGVNIDKTQIAHARRLALDSGMEERLEFHVQEQCITDILVNGCLSITYREGRPICHKVLLRFSM